MAQDACSNAVITPRLVSANRAALNSKRVGCLGQNREVRTHGVPPALLDFVERSVAVRMTWRPVPASIVDLISESTAIEVLQVAKRVTALQVAFDYVEYCRVLGCSSPEFLPEDPFSAFRSCAAHYGKERWRDITAVERDLVLKRYQNGALTEVAMLERVPLIRDSRHACRMDEDLSLVDAAINYANPPFCARAIKDVMACFQPRVESLVPLAIVVPKRYTQLVSNLWYEVLLPRDGGLGELVFATNSRRVAIGVYRTLRAEGVQVSPNARLGRLL